MLFEQELTDRVFRKLGVKGQNGNDLVVFEMAFKYPLLSTPVKQKPTLGPQLSYAKPYQAPPVDEEVWEYIVEHLVEEIEKRFPTLKLHSVRNSINVPNMEVNFSVCGSYR